MEKLCFLETWKMNWGSAKATGHCGTFPCEPGIDNCSKVLVNGMQGLCNLGCNDSEWGYGSYGQIRCLYGVHDHV